MKGREIERGEKRVSPYLTMISGSQQEIRVSRDLMDNKENNERKPLDMVEKKKREREGGGLYCSVLYCIAILYNVAHSYWVNQYQ